MSKPRVSRITALVRAANIPSDAVLWDEREDHRGRLWQVYLCDPLSTRDLARDYDGRCLFEGQLILLSVVPLRHEQDENYLHEWTHVAYDAAGTLTDAQEEAAVEPISTHLLPIVKSLGFRVPARPKEAEALERFARARSRAFERLYEEEDT